MPLCLNSSIYYWKCHFPLNPNVRVSVGRLVGPSVCHNFRKERKLHFHAPIGALDVYNTYIDINLSCLRWLIRENSLTLSEILYIREYTSGNLRKKWSQG